MLIHDEPPNHEAPAKSGGHSASQPSTATERGIRTSESSQRRDAKTHAKRRYRRARDFLTRIAAKVHATSGLSAEELLRVKRLLKRHRTNTSVAKTNSTAADLDAAARDLARRLDPVAVREIERRLDRGPQPARGRRNNHPTVAVEYAGQPKVTTAAPHRLPIRTEEDLEEHGRRLRLANAIQNGVAVREAILAVGYEYTPARRRWAYRLAAQHRVTGSVHDRRKDRQTQTSVMTQDMKDLVVALWSRYREAGSGALLTLIARYIESERARLRAGEARNPKAPLSDNAILNGVALPAPSTIRRFIRTLPRPLHTLREGGMRQVHRQERPLAAMPVAAAPNDVWQIDHTPLDVYVKVKVNGEWRRARPYLTVALDEYSRAIAGYVISLRAPDSFTLSHLLRRAILPKQDPKTGTPIRNDPVFGLPRLVVLDNGKDLTANNTKAVLGALGIETHYCKPHNPDEKAHVERFFLTVRQGFARTFIGYTRSRNRGKPWDAQRIESLDTVERLRALFAEWITTKYHATKHRATNEPPATRFAARRGLIASVNPRDLDVLLLHKKETRIVGHGLVGLTWKRLGRVTYTAPGLAAYNGVRVQVHYSPDDPASVLVFDAANGDFIAEAWATQGAHAQVARAQVHEDSKDFKASIRKAQRSVLDRLPEAFEEAQATDRPSLDAIKDALPAVSPAPPNAEEDEAALLAAEYQATRAARLNALAGNPPADQQQNDVPPPRADAATA